MITGIGILSPVGLDTASSWSALLAGQSGVAPIQGFDPERIETRIACEMKGFDPETVMERKEARKLDRCSLTAVAAAREAWAQSGASMDDPGRVGVIVGSAFGGAATIQSGMQTFFEKGPHRIGPHLHGAMLVDTPGFEIARDLGALGTNFSVTAACATGASAIGVAADLVASGNMDVCLAGGVDTLITEYILGGFCNMKVLGAPREGEDVTTASRPFDATRDGFVLGEGATVVVLEREADARARGAEIIAEIVSWAVTNDAYHIAAPREDCVGIDRMFAAALQRGDIGPAEVDDGAPDGRCRRVRGRRRRAGRAAAHRPADHQLARSRPALRPRLRVGRRARAAESRRGHLQLDRPRWAQRRRRRAPRVVVALGFSFGVAGEGDAGVSRRRARA